MNRDPLAEHLARGRVDQAQYLAGREFQKHFGLADQANAGEWLAKCYRKLGADGSALVHDMLIHARTAKQQIAASRGLTGQEWERYFAKRFWECLNTLVLVYGFSNGQRKIRASGAKN